MIDMLRRSGVIAAIALVMSVGAQAAERTPLPAGSYEVAQATDPRVYQLEEQVRALNGRIEELNFQLLQLQEDMRRMQEDNEFRFQQLEGGGGDGAGTDTGSAEPMEMEDNSVAAASGEREAPVTVVPDGQASAGSADAAQPPRDLGSITMDEEGNVTGGSVDFSANSVGSAIDGQAVASVNTDNPDALYREGYDYALAGEYGRAESVFRTFVELHPNDELAGDAQFWLAESVRAQGRLEEAAEIFIAHKKANPDGKKAPETLLKIGMIMADLGNRELACVTYADAEKNYPDMSDSVRARLRDERLEAKC